MFVQGKFPMHGLLDFPHKTPLGPAKDTPTILIFYEVSLETWHTEKAVE